MPTHPLVRHALVTGACGSIGRAIVDRLTQAGFEVSLTDVSPAVHAVAEAAAPSARAFEVDLASRDARRGLIDQLHAPVDVLVNNAALVATIGFTHELSIETWERDLAVNLTAPFHLCSLVLGGMAERGWGRIVNIGSIGAQGLYRQPAYAASKAGLIGLTKTVALEYAEHGVTANVIAPGIVASDAVERMPADIRGGILTVVPAGRPGRVEEVADTVGFLVSEEATYINGAVLPVDGGASSTAMRMVRKPKGGALH